MEKTKSKLVEKKCKPCEGGIPPLNKKEIEEYFAALQSNWDVVDNKAIRKVFSFVNYKHTMENVNKIADLAEAEGHHPVMHVYYAELEIELWTHAINGLSENDFILAAKIDDIVI